MIIQQSLRRIGSVAAIVLCLAATSFAQRSGGGGSDFGGGHGGGAGGGGDSGNEKATISRFAPAREGQDSIQGTLSVQTESGKRINLEIRQKDGIKIQIGSHEIAPEDYEKYLLPGLGINVSWNTNKVGKKVSYLQSISFETIAIEGKIMGVDDDGGKIRVLSAPANNQKWPTLKKPPTPKPPKPKPPSSTGGGSGTGSSKPPKPPVTPKEKPVQRKSLQLRFFEGVSSITDNAKQTLTPGDLRNYKDQQFNGTIIFGSRVCVLVDGQIEGEKQEKTTDAGSGDSKGG